MDFVLTRSSGLTLMTGFWYTRREIPLRQCIWYSSLGWGGMVCQISCQTSRLEYADNILGRVLHCSGDHWTTNEHDT